MYKIMLCCSAGMSTSMLVRKMVEAAKERDLPVKIDAYGVTGSAGEVHVKKFVRKGRHPKYSRPGN